MGGCVVASERATLGDELSIKKAIAIGLRHIQQANFSPSRLSTLIKKESFFHDSLIQLLKTQLLIHDRH